MEITRNVRCPYCGQTFELCLDTSIGYQRFDTDCTACGRPLEVVAECEPGTVVSLDIVAE